MFKYEIESSSPEQTGGIGESIGQQLQGGAIVCLYGELGAGKTTLIKGIAIGAGIRDYVTSPSFTLINEYRGRLPFYHFDLYRLEGNDIHELGFREYFYGKGICVIEWADKLKDLMPGEKIDIHLDYTGNGSRKLSVKSPVELSKLG